MEALSDRQTPAWLGLPNKAERVLLTNHGVDLIAKLLKLQLLEDDDDIVVVAGDDASESAAAAAAAKDTDGRPAWMRTLLNSASTWLRLIPTSLATMRRTSDNIKEPLYRYFEREVNNAAKLLALVRHDLEDVIAICRAEKKQTNYHREITECLAKGMVPAQWKRAYRTPDAFTVIQWVTDFADRIKQMQTIAASSTANLKVTTPPLRHLSLTRISFPVAESQHLAWWPLQSRGVHHRHTAVRRPGQWVVVGGVGAGDSNRRFRQPAAPAGRVLVRCSGTDAARRRG